MKHPARTHVTIIITCLILALSISACVPADVPENIPEITPEADTEVTTPPVTEHHVTIGNNLFTLRYDPNSSLNPITSQSTDNLLVSQLLYEGLFALDGAFEVHPVLCESIETADNLVYTVTVKPDIAMNDGEILTAGDVAYSLNAARGQGRFANRLSCIGSVSAPDSLTVIITLKAPNIHLAELLDIPIIKNGTIDYRVPPGTGPYTYVGGDNQYLTRFKEHRDYGSLPISTVYLTECGNLELIERFSDGLIDLLWDDPTDSAVFESSRQHDIRAYNTTMMQFIGFSTRTDALKIPDIRRAIGLAVDREYIAGEIMSGYALPSPLAFSPAYTQYSSGWEHSEGDILLTMSEIISAAGFMDDDNDSYLEFPVPGLGYQPFSIDFIVNSENPFKVSAAENIADSLRHVGFNVTVRALKWDMYTEALNTGDFEMYLGDVMLGADFDLSPLLLPDGRLNYGDTGDALYEPYLTAYFAAGSPAAEAIAARQLCDMIYESAPFIPVVYKKHLMRSYRGVVSGASPSQSSIFYGLTNWTIVPGTNIRALP